MYQFQDNLWYTVQMKICLACGNSLQKRFQLKYCSNKCQSDRQYNIYILSWKKGKKDGGRGISTRNISRHIKRFLIETNGEYCTTCGWRERHPITGQVPLEIDHIDGNSENNKEINLRLLCPNCHALTPSFKKLNNGKGRVWREEKYLRNKSIDKAVSKIISK